MGRLRAPDGMGRPMEALTAWIVALMISLSPPDKGAAAGRFVPDAVETTEQRTERYREIAAAIAAVAFDPDETPAFGGKGGRHATATLLLGISWMESGWRRDVDLGLGKLARGSGMDSCLMQIRLGRGETTKEGWTWEDLTSDREKCFRAGLRIIRRSMAACRELPLEHRLSAYATGTCATHLLGTNRMAPGWSKSASRFAVHRRLFDRLPRPALPQPPAQGGGTTDPTKPVLAAGTP